MNTTLRIGIVNPDTSHARAFATFLQGRSDVMLTAVMSMSGIRAPEHVARFAEEFELEIATTPSEFVQEIHAALILGADWQLHLPLTEYLMGEGASVLIDKPLAGSLPDLRMLQTFAGQHPGKLFGGSALPFISEVAEFRSKLESKGLQGLTISGPRDSYFMGIHAAELLASFVELGDDTTCEYDPETGDTLFTTPSGFECGLLQSDEGWEIIAQTAEGEESLIVPLENPYENYLLAFQWMLQSGEMFDLSAAVDGVVLELASARSGLRGRSVRLGELDGTDKIISHEFIQSYKQQYYDVPL